MMSVLARLLLFFMAAALVACGEVSYSDVLSHPESHLYYPGSRVITRSGGGEHRGGLDTGRTPAQTNVILAVDAPMSKIYSWYEAHLAAMGWSLRKTETINGGYELFTKGKNQVFEVSPDPKVGTYAIYYAILPAACATQDPIPLDRATGNC
jgi:hypothetical protein